MHYAGPTSHPACHTGADGGRHGARADGRHHGGRRRGGGFYDLLVLGSQHVGRDGIGRVAMDRSAASRSSRPLRATVRPQQACANPRISVFATRIKRPPQPALDQTVRRDRCPRATPTAPWSCWYQQLPAVLAQGAGPPAVVCVTRSARWALVFGLVRLLFQQNLQRYLKPVGSRMFQGFRSGSRWVSGSQGLRSGLRWASRFQG
jgi:hypothetical protein